MANVSQTRGDRVILNCPNCRKYGMRLRRRMRRQDPIIWQVHDGKKLIPVLCCKEHEDFLIARGGWDNTGKRQA